MEFILGGRPSPPPNRIVCAKARQSHCCDVDILGKLAPNNARFSRFFEEILLENPLQNLWPIKAMKLSEEN